MFTIALCVCVAAGLGACSRKSEPRPASPFEPETSSTEALAFAPPTAVRVPLPYDDRAEAIWGGTGADDADHIWIGLCQEQRDGASARLLEFDPETSHLIDHGDVVGALKAAGVYRRGESQSKIHTRIHCGKDGDLYFASMDTSGASFDSAAAPPVYGGHLWRFRPAEGHWEHLLATPKGLIALAGSGPYLYALGFFGHEVYRYDLRSGKSRSVVVGSVDAHISRNILADGRGHVYVSRLWRNTTAGELTATLVELDTDLNEVAQTELRGYLEGKPSACHGIVSLQPLSDGSIAFVTSAGRLYRVAPGERGPARVVDMGWIHPSGSMYVASLFADDTNHRLIALATQNKDTGGGKTYEWVAFDWRTGQRAVAPFSVTGAAWTHYGNLLLYGSVTRDRFGNAYVVGVDWARREPVFLQVQFEGGGVGSLRVVLGPEAATEAGGQWRVDGGDWIGSGNSVEGLRAGSHVVEYREIGILDAPARECATVLPNETTFLTRRYIVPAALVIDNRDEADYRAFRVLSGQWKTERNGKGRWPEGDRKADYARAEAREGLGDASAEWRCTNLPAGVYRVEVRWPALSDMAQTVACEVLCAEGPVTLRVDQNERGGEWVYLGTYRFDAGRHAVRIENGFSAPGKTVAADAVRFTREETTPRP